MVKAPSSALEMSIWVSVQMSAALILTWEKRRAAQMAGYCWRNLSTMWKVLLHLIATSAFNFWGRTCCCFFLIWGMIVISISSYANTRKVQYPFFWYCYFKKKCLEWIRDVLWVVSTCNRARNQHSAWPSQQTNWVYHVFSLIYFL